MRKLDEHLDLPQTTRANPVKWHSTHDKSYGRFFRCITAEHQRKIRASRPQRDTVSPPPTK